jgi:hypothetical protein
VRQTVEQSQADVSPGDVNGGAVAVGTEYSRGLFQQWCCLFYAGQVLDSCEYAFVKAIWPTRVKLQIRWSDHCPHHTAR